MRTHQPAGAHHSTSATGGAATHAVGHLSALRPCRFLEIRHVQWQPQLPLPSLRQDFSAPTARSGAGPSWRTAQPPVCGRARPPQQGLRCFAGTTASGSSWASSSPQAWLRMFDADIELPDAYAIDFNPNGGAQIRKGEATGWPAAGSLTPPSISFFYTAPHHLKTAPVCGFPKKTQL